MKLMLWKFCIVPFASFSVKAEKGTTAVPWDGGIFCPRAVPEPPNALPLEPKLPVVPAPPWPKSVLLDDPDPKAGLLAVLPKAPPPKLPLVLLFPKALLFVLDPNAPVVEPPKLLVVLLFVFPKRPPDDDVLLFEPKRPVLAGLLPKRPPPVLVELPKPITNVSRNSFCDTKIHRLECVPQLQACT